MTDQQQPPSSIASETLSAAQLQQRVDEHEAEAARLEAKLQDFSKYELENGTFDSRAYKRDELRYQQINRELARMYSMRGQVEQRSNQWVEFARKKAADFVRGRLPRYPEGVRDTIQQEFVSNFKETLASGIFQQPDAQSEEQITNIIRDRFENAVGRAYSIQANEQEGTEKTPPREAGLDRDDESSGAEEEDDWAEGDELARALYSQYEEQRNRKPKTLAEQQKARYEALHKIEKRAAGGDA